MRLSATRLKRVSVISTWQHTKMRSAIHAHHINLLELTRIARQISQ